MSKLGAGLTRKKIRIGELLIQHGRLTEEQLQQALAEQKRSGRRLGQTIVAMNFVSETDLLTLLSQQLGIPFVDVRHYQHNPDVVKKLPETHARRFRSIVLEDTGDDYVLGMADPTDLFAVDELTRILDRPLRQAIVREGDLLSAIDRVYQGQDELASLVAELDEELAALRMAGVGFDEQRAHYDRRVEPAGGAFLLYFRHYRTADGLVSVAGISPGLVARFHQITGLRAPEVRDTDDPDFRRLVTEAEELFASRTTAEWIADLRAGGYPCGPYNLPHEAIDDPQVRANAYMIDLEHPTIGTYSTSGMPMRFEKGTASVPGPSPGLGQHTRSMLAEIGLDEATTDRLVGGGIVLDGNIEGSGA